MDKTNTWRKQLGEKPRLYRRKTTLTERYKNRFCINRRTSQQQQKRETAPGNKARVGLKYSTGDTAGKRERENTISL